MSDSYPRFRAATVQAAPVWLNRDATIEKIDVLVGEAARNGAALVAFAESFLPGFPVWNLTHRPLDQPAFFRRLHANAVLIPGPHVERLGTIARRYGVHLSVGLTERHPRQLGTLWNSNVIFAPSGRLINWRRKLVATWAEKLTWAAGDAWGLDVVDTPLGRLGALICGENTNTLARFALLAQGEQVHIATYPPAWPFKRSHSPGGYDLNAAIRTRAAAHSFEGKLFTIVSSAVLDDVAKNDLAGDDPWLRELLDECPPPVSLVVGPLGTPVVEPLVSAEGILYADIDVADCIEHRLVHDIAGGYQRFDLFHLEVDRTPYTHEPVRFFERRDVRVEPEARTKTRYVPGNGNGAALGESAGAPSDANAVSAREQ
jgi:nitrilase